MYPPPYSRTGILVPIRQLNTIGLTTLRQNILYKYHLILILHTFVLLTELLRKKGDLRADPLSTKTVYILLYNVRYSNSQFSPSNEL